MADHPTLATSTPTTSPSKLTLVLEGVPPNWLNWKRGLKERIRSRTDWKERASLAARVARAKSGWLLPKNSDHRSVAIRCFRVRQLDHDGLHASVKPIIDGLKYVQYVRLGKRGT